MPRTWIVPLALTLGVTASLLCAGCGGEGSPSSTPTPTPNATLDVTPASPLADALEAKAAESAGMMPPEVLALFKKAGEELAASDVMKQALAVGGTAPDFALPDGLGKPVSLATLLKKGPVVVAFYRGKW